MFLLDIVALVHSLCQSMSETLQRRRIMWISASENFMALHILLTRYAVKPRSSYSALIKQAKYGKSKEGDHLPQINLALLYGEESMLPVYCRKLAGN